MDFNDKLTQVLCNLIPILQVVSSQLSDAVSNTNVPKKVRVEELNPVVKFEFGPLSIDHLLYTSDRELKSMKLSRKLVRSLREGKRPERRKTGNQDTPVWKARKGNAESENQKHHDGDQPSEEPSGILQQINDIKTQIKSLKMLSESLENLKVKLRELEDSLAIEPLEKVLKYLEKSFGNKTKMAEGNRMRGINNTTYNNQYQIENVFIINRLSKENNSELKETDAEIFNELTVRKMEELLEKAVNNLKKNGIPAGDVPSVTQLPLEENEMDLLKHLRTNFSSATHQKNDFLERLNQMSKIIDFVERYHGTVSSLKGFEEDDRKERNAETKRKKAARKRVLSDDGCGVYKSEDVDEETVMRRKGRFLMKGFDERKPDERLNRRSN